MSSVAEKTPVDIDAVCTRLASTRGSGNAVNALLYHDIPAMVAEIKAWRSTCAAWLAASETYPATLDSVTAAADFREALRALLPAVKS